LKTFKRYLELGAMVQQKLAKNAIYHPPFTIYHLDLLPFSLGLVQRLLAQNGKRLHGKW